MIATSSPTNPGKVVSVRVSAADARFVGRNPAIAPLHFSSKTVTPGIVGERHYELASEVRRTPAQYPELKDYPERALCIIGAINEAKGKGAAPE